MDVYDSGCIILELSCLDISLSVYQKDNFSPDDYDDFYYDGLTLIYGYLDENFIDDYEDYEYYQLYGNEESHYDEYDSYGKNIILKEYDYVKYY